MNIDQLNLKTFCDEIQCYLEELFEKIDKKLIPVLNPQVFIYDIEQGHFIFENVTKSSTNNEKIETVFKQKKNNLTQEFLNEFPEFNFRIYSSTQKFSLHVKNCSFYIFVKFAEDDKLDNNEYFLTELISRFLRISSLYFLSYLNNDFSNEGIKSLFPVEETLVSTAREIIWRKTAIPRSLFDDFNIISTLPHEGEECFGQIVYVSKKQGNENIEMIINFETPVILSEHRKIRKLLNLSNKNNFLVLQDLPLKNKPDDSDIYGIGIGKLKDSNSCSEEDNLSSQENWCVINFQGHFLWELGYSIKTSDPCKNTKPIIVVKNGQPSLPQKRIDKLEFKNYCEDIFTNIQQSDMDDLWEVLEQAIEQKHGTMLVILDTNTAKDEADRLGGQCFKITPKKLNAELIKELTSIDGSLLLSSDGNCHAIGVILDGQAAKGGDSSRGSRYNSAIRYSESMKGKHELLIVVISEDGMINFISQN